MVKSSSVLLLRTMFGSMTLTQPRSVLMSVAPATTEGCEDRASDCWTCPSLAAVLGRTGPVPTGCTLGRADPAPLLGSTVEVILLVGVQVSLPWGNEVGDLALSHLICHVVAWLRERCSPSSPLATYNRQENWLWEHENRRVDTLLANCNPWESRYCTWPWWCGCCWSGPKAWKQKKWLYPFIPAALHELAGACWRAHPGVRIRGS